MEIVEEALEIKFVIGMATTVLMEWTEPTVA